MTTADQIKDLRTRCDALRRYLAIDARRIELEEEQLRTQAPDFWEDAKRAEEQMKKVKGIEKWITGYEEANALTSEAELALEFYRDEMLTDEELDTAYAKAVEAI